MAECIAAGSRPPLQDFGTGCAVLPAPRMHGLAHWQHFLRLQRTLPSVSAPGLRQGPLSVRRTPGLWCALLAVLCMLCISPPVLGEGAAPPAAPSCHFEDLRIDSNFPAGRLSTCKKTAAREYVLSVEPENRPVNPSPWYAFRIQAEKKREIVVHLGYSGYRHRYTPKISRDEGMTWTRLTGDAWQVSPRGSTVTLHLRAGPAPQLIAAQEIVDNDDYADWMSRLAASARVQKSLLGKSVQGRGIYQLVSRPTRPAGAVVIVGRQHPPEIPGALASMHFVERLLRRDSLARAFGERFLIIAVPNLNPDGVARGHWRHNANGKDLNRDWGPFTQPETRLMRDILAALQLPGAPRLLLFLDFHSTNRNVFYTQAENAPTRLPAFTRRWVQAIDQRFPQYQLQRGVSRTENKKTTARSYVYRSFRAPSITYEAGDETDRETVRQVAVYAAEKMMQLLLEAVAK